MKIIKLYIISFLFLFSCKKYGDGSISGTVYDIQSNIPVPNAEVSILRTYQKYDLHGSVQHGQEEIILSTSTDNNGNYKINFHKKVGSKYFIKCSSGSFYTRDILESINYKNFTHDIYIKPYRYFKVRVVKTSINASKRIDITLPLNQFSSVNALNAIDTTLPIAFKAIGFEDNIIEYYIYSSFPNPTSSWFTENINLQTSDTIVKTFIID